MDQDIGFFKGRSYVQKGFTNKSSGNHYLHSLFDKLYKGSQSLDNRKSSNYDEMKRVAERLGHLIRKTDEIQSALNQKIDDANNAEIFEDHDLNADFR
mmetsp:Transcript_11984/g.10364  ORF Transcript_11984/g.10364 Transcript_11984/m.10364 type:complete len:98 (-) Transcript_11984:579-872(-)